MLFRYLVQSALKEERLKFAEKQESRPEGESDPKVEEAIFVEPINVFVVDINESTKEVGPN